MAGVAAIRDNAHLYHLFVDQRPQEKGFGTQRWAHAKRTAIQAGNRGHFTVNSTVFAVTVYEAFGFRVTGPKTERNGIPFFPMTLKI
ncbi:GNAT family N-acetyltransferase [Ralstonia solanacearum]|uniref:GNAT family N-acetyltransferase n=1 Tax=Ralstonia solanacearum TaxID=305 RepID=UPI000BE78A3F|nr:GNAT family N-acetyltransferase [Ralstonia solanacearum]ATJ87858.1 GNAT family N-acetyltransferase [Ralstonia solanacearum]